MILQARANFDCRCNNVWSLATIKIMRQIILLPRHDCRGNNLFCNKIMAWQIQAIATSLIVAYTTSCNGGGRGNCLYCHDHERCNNVLLPCLATNQYGWDKPQQLQRQSSNGCNILLQRDLLQPLVTNVIWLQHVPSATKLGLLQPFFVVAQGLEVSSGSAWRESWAYRSWIVVSICKTYMWIRMILWWKP